MELVVKIYQDKPPGIGVKYTYDYQAQRSYEELIKRSGWGLHALTLEPVRDRLNVVLTSEQTGIKTIYKDLEFKLEQIKRLRDIFLSEQQVKFVHVFPKNNILIVAKPFGKTNFITVCKFELINV